MEDQKAGKCIAHAGVLASVGEVRLGLDLGSLQRYLALHAPHLLVKPKETDDPRGLGTTLECSQFGTGTSNPTYLVWQACKPAQRFVLRRKPPGQLAKGAHQIDREFRAQRALQGSGVPVPEMHVYCEDVSVVGAPFYLMDCVPGRTFGPVGGGAVGGGLRPEERAQAWESLCDAAAELHSVDFRAVGLSDFGRLSGDYVQRQLRTWQKSFQESIQVVAKILPRQSLARDMEDLFNHLERFSMPPEPTTLVHGDLGMHNAILHPAEPRVEAILDWEMCTLGHPMLDLNYMLAPLQGGCRASLQPAEALTGTPSNWAMVERYHRRRGLPTISAKEWEYFTLVNTYRWVAIAHGVYARILGGNAGSDEAQAPHWWTEINSMDLLVSNAAHAAKVAADENVRGQLAGMAGATKGGPLPQHSKL